MVDGIDNRIIGLLRKNSRYSFAEIGRIISLSPSSVRVDRAVNVYHLRRMKVSSANQVHEIDSFWC
ncbi:AsnC family protein [Flagellimonas oceanensis]|uniref:AsnC family protein n=1 Tax=Flagellimonas oceanensis TaxID=2499163 RepID=UPI000F8E1422|nr:AsnC family protein [Allomuricauda oceanensis]